MVSHRIPNALKAFWMWVLLLVVASAVVAQEDALPLAIGQNVTGEITGEVSKLEYAVNTSGGENVTILALKIDEALSLSFQVTNPQGVVVLDVPDANPIASSVTLSDAGEYHITVEGSNGTVGRFLLSLQPNAALPTPEYLTLNEAVVDSVDDTTPVRLYRFTNSPDESLPLTFLTDAPDTGLLVSLFDETAGRTIASSDAGLSGITYRFRPGSHSYHLEIRANSAAGETAYHLCLGSCEGDRLFPTLGDASATPDVNVSETPATTEDACHVVVNNVSSVNVRAGNGTQFAIIGTLTSGSSLPALGRLSGGDWVQVRLNNGGVGWVAASVSRLEGDCGTLPIVAAPLNAPLAATQPAPTQPPLAGSGAVPTVIVPTTVSTTFPTTIPTEAPPLPDISVQIVIAADEPPNGVTLYYTVYYTDTSGNPVSPAFSDTVCLDDICVSTGSATVASNGSLGQQVTFSRDNIDPTRVAHTFRVTVDAQNNVAESNESNNIGTYNTTLN